MNTAELDAILLAIGALITALAGFVKVVIDGQRNRRQLGKVMASQDRTEAQMSPNSGHSLADKIETLIKVQAEHGVQVRSIGYQIGELRDDYRTVYEDLAARIRRLENGH